MKYFESIYLNDAQLKQIDNLHNICEAYDGFSILTFCDNNYNLYEEMPCFFLVYNDETLAGFLSAFVPSDSECEIYSFVHPEYRKQNIFTDLLKMFLPYASEYNIDNILIPVSPENTLAPAVLKKMEACYFNSEYSLLYSKCAQIPSPVHKDEKKLSVVFDATESEYVLKYCEQPIGSCMIHSSKGCICIYSFEINSDKRSNGYGSYFLDYIVSEHIRRNENILLQVNSENTVAYNMYLRHNFTIYEQIDYWKY